MALRTNKRRHRKKLAQDTQWPKVPGWVFERLNVDRETLAGLEQQLVGKMVLPGMPDYKQDRLGDFLSPYQDIPAIIIYCHVFNDVRLCLQWARQYGWWVACRSGGHSFAGYSVNTGAVIDVSALSYVCVDPAAKRARVGAGTQFAQLNSMLNTYRLHVPGGTCPDVGVAGYMQGGGYGLTSRQHGMHCDNVLEVTMMLYDGRIVVANANKNADLFWAVRGGAGGNFGVLLEIGYQLADLYSLWGFCLQWSLDEAGQAIAAMQERYMRDAPAELGYLTVIAMIKGEPRLVMLGMYNGPVSGGMELIAPLCDVGDPSLTAYEQPYAQLNDSLFGVLSGPAPGQPMASFAGYLDAPPAQADWEQIARYYASTPHPANIAVIEPYGGQIARTPPAENAFVHRGPLMNFFATSFYAEGSATRRGAAPPPTRDKALAWLARYQEMVSPHFSGAVYQNYPMRSFPNFRWAYWGDAFNTLLFVKQKYDPEHVFHYEQSISPYPDGDGITRSTAPSLFSDPSIAYEPYSESFIDEPAAVGL